jgi:hypothetical protein
VRVRDLFLGPRHLGQYVDRRIREGNTKREALRALKRHISRDLFKRLSNLALTHRWHVEGPPQLKRG